MSKVLDVSERIFHVFFHTKKYNEDTFIPSRVKKREKKQSTCYATNEMGLKSFLKMFYKLNNNDAREML